MEKPHQKQLPPNNPITFGFAEAAGSMDAYFDCSICLECAVDPVVTLCGHLYCWPCVYQWMQLKSISHQHCPVCKASLSQESLIPLYSRGRPQHTIKGDDSGIPRRPTPPRHRDHEHDDLSYPVQQLQLHQNNRHVSGSSRHGSLVGTDLRSIPSIHRGSFYHARSDYRPLDGSRTRLRRLMDLECLLHQLWFFLFFLCVVWLLLFLLISLTHLRGRCHV